MFRAGMVSVSVESLNRHTVKSERPADADGHEDRVAQIHFGLARAEVVAVNAEVLILHAAHDAPPVNVCRICASGMGRSKS